MIPKTISPTELRQNLYRVVREVARGKNQYLVTPSEEEGVVMLSRKDYNAIIAERDLMRDLREAEADIAAGRTLSTEEMRAHLARLSKKKPGKRVPKRR